MNSNRNSEPILEELLTTADIAHGHRSVVEELIASGMDPSEASQRLLEGLSSGTVVELDEDQIYLAPHLRRGW